MTTDKQLEIARTILDTGLVTKVYHSCIMLRNDQDQRLYPAFQRGAEYIYAGIDDTKGLFAYIRTNGDSAATQERIASCGNSYELAVPLRVVFFNDHEKRNQADLLTKLLTFTFLANVTLQRVIDDRHRLVREESDLFRAKLDGKSFYVAFDVLVNVVLLPNQCAQPLCEAPANPICQ